MSQGRKSCSEELCIQVLGELRVERGGALATLPPSRKTRALLAYLALTGREHRRARLSEMFWDVADDPRGALRWSLSKIRALVDTPPEKRLVANRETARLELRGARLDLLALRQEVARTDLADAPVATLEGWAGLFRGEALEGLDLPDFDDYQAWCIAEREEARKLRARILEELTHRLQSTPEEALPHARAWLTVDPLSLEARVLLMRTAMAAGRRAEAEQHYQAGQRMLAELGVDRTQSLSEAWRALTSEPAPSLTAVASPPVGAPSSFPPLAPISDLVGRDRERSTLLATLQSVRDRGEERLVLLEGESGIGKSRMLDEVLAAARALGATVVHGAAFEGESGRPYGPWIDALRAIGPIDDRVDDSSAALEPMVPDLQKAPPGEAGRDRLYARVSDFVAFRAFKTGLVVVAFDDVQWLDAASAELLHYVARTSRHRSLAVILSARDDELSDNAPVARVLRSLRRDADVETLTLAPLDARAIGRLVSGLGADSERVFEQSGGNPLFALELARAGASLGESPPDSLLEVVRERIGRLGPEAGDVLRWASVLGPSFAAERFESLMALPPSQILDALELLERQSLLRADDGEGARYAFTHGVVRSAIYADLSEPRRRLMHRRVAERLHAEGPTDDASTAELARHAALGQDHALAAEACVQAGRRCLRVFANDQAAMLAQRGLRHARSLHEPESVTRAIELLEVQVEARRPAEIGPVLAELEELGNRSLDLGCAEHARLAFHLLSYLTWETGAWTDARRHMLRAEMASRSADPEDQVAAMAEAARCLVLLERDIAHAHALLKEADARARPLRIEPAAIADGLGLLELHRGALDDAATQFTRAETIASVERNHAMQFYALEHLVAVELERGDFDAASRIVPRLARLAERLRDGSEAPFARAVAALVEHALHPGRSEALEAALEPLRAVDAKHRLAFVLTRAAMVDVERGELERASDRAEEALELAEILERPSERALALGLLVAAHRGLGEAEAADLYLENLVQRGLDQVASPVIARLQGWGCAPTPAPPSLSPALG